MEIHPTPSSSRYTRRTFYRSEWVLKKECVSVHASRHTIHLRARTILHVFCLTLIVGGNFFIFTSLFTLICLRVTFLTTHNNWSVVGPLWCQALNSSLPISFSFHLTFLARFVCLIDPVEFLFPSKFASLKLNSPSLSFAPDSVQKNRKTKNKNWNSQDTEFGQLKWHKLKSVMEQYQGSGLYTYHNIPVFTLAY